ncbi:MAG: Nif3-like dinuclear metal center hexameric protein [Chloroflexota bacterium]|jgi:dinuclear metal center YbgI/SA1388 family protein
MDTNSIGSIFEEIAPASLAESWDNVGWQVRVPGQPVTGVLLSLDVNIDVVQEAGSLGCNLIFAHHPMLFKPLRSLDLDTTTGRVVAEAVRRGISVWAAHTNLDVVQDGTSFALAGALGLKDLALLSRIDRKEYKLVVYVPPSHVEAVKDAMAQAGAGKIGNYTHCFWQVLGTGQFRPEQGASPYLGEVGQEERVEEFRVEGVVPHDRLAAVLAAMHQAHPYEEVAYDLLPLASAVNSVGYGAIGSLTSPTTTARIAKQAATTLSSDLCQVAGKLERKHSRIAVLGGSGGHFIGDVLRSDATLYITADIRYHDAQDAVGRGLDLVILDHFATERPVLDVVRARLEPKLEGIPIRIATTRSTPYVRV